MNNPDKTPRARARRLAMQATYQRLMGGGDIDAIEEQYLADAESRAADGALLRRLLRGPHAAHDELLAQLQPRLDRPFEKVDPVEQAILLIAAYELLHTPLTPAAVVINEAVELAKTYGAEQSHRFINAVLDKLAADARAAPCPD